MRSIRGGESHLLPPRGDAWQARGACYEEALIHEQVSFTGPDSSLFVAVARPEGDANVGVVVCSPLWAEQMKNYRREVLLSRALAARGLLCARFHYRGVGHSRGLSAHIDISRMVDDAAALSEVLRSEFGITTLVLVGTRLGALAATRAAARTAADGLVLWDPVLDPAKYFKEIMRARLMTEIRSGGGGTTEQLLEEMRTAGFVDVLGFAVLQEIYEEALTSSLAEEVGNTEIPTLAVAFSRSGEVAPDLAECGAQWRSSGRDVDIEAFRFAEAWWFTEEISRLDLPGKESAPLVRLTADWFTDRFVVGPVAA